MIIGYARVSSQSQNLDRQIEDLKKHGCEHIVREKISGKNFERPEYRKMRKQLRFGDTLVVHDLSRFGRNKQEIIKEWEGLIEDNIDIVVLNLPVLNTAQYKDMEGVGKLVSEIFLSVMSWLVEEERLRIKTAQKEGIKIAKRKGKYKGGQVQYHENATGRNKVMYDRIISELRKRTSVMDISRQTGVARNTIYKIKRELGK
ncbi:recombinase family protein [Bacillus carboniphilus]|uniref:Recombinase family protein n=1 Tax=Bacillus carboniphilus TaxID=86663 RepID=A0ABY9JQQ4_9BACI|nr:recombinase family protein [Bacillus carboniphilus]WLR41737.1 recombinase family protein [Bacillus carboniphilus]